MPERRLQLLPRSLLGRLSLVMVAGVLVTQLAGSMIWAAQQRAKSEAEVRAAAEYLGHSASAAIRFFRSLPPSYRGLMIQQTREMGGMRLFVNLNREALPTTPIASNALADTATATILATLKADLPQIRDFRLAFSWPDQLMVSRDGGKIGDLPESWVRHVLLVEPEPAPVLVIQTELEPGHWLHFATLMPNPYFLNSNNPLSADRLALQGLSLAAVLLLSFLVVRSITRPLAGLSDAAETFGKGGDIPALPESGSREVVNTVRAFNAMRLRILGFMEERDRLFISISHDLRTPITRLKLRAGLMDDETLRDEFEEDLDELDMMVKGALQLVKDRDIHENAADVRLDPLILRMVRGASLAGHAIAYQEAGLAVRAKPLALKRAIGNLIDNALSYGERAEVSVGESAGWIEIRVCDQGPGVPEDALSSLSEPYVRLPHGRKLNAAGTGLGLNITRRIVESHGGELVLANRPAGGLCATIRMPS
ncbi:MAG: ATP-binding protein [Massilia sp.]